MATLLIDVTCLTTTASTSEPKCCADYLPEKRFETVRYDFRNRLRGARKHVFSKLLEAEAEASQPGFRERSRITPENYADITGATARGIFGISYGRLILSGRRHQ